mmetsp:Transcript_91544/g.179311  ORF Transcript_91544/g.179311 Transcript_91544/m.179311 type:complete len:215 (+) Transcript_91544:623-1267(+)
MKERMGAMPVPRPTMTMGTVSSFGNLKVPTTAAQASLLPTGARWMNLVHAPVTTRPSLAAFHWLMTMVKSRTPGAKKGLEAIEYKRGFVRGTMDKIWSNGGFADGNCLQTSKKVLLASTIFFQSSAPSAVAMRCRALFSAALEAKRARSAQKDFVGRPKRSNISVKTWRTVTRFSKARLCRSDTLSETHVTVATCSPTRPKCWRAASTSSFKFS